MLVLAIESSSRFASVALLREGRLLGQQQLDRGGRTARLLAPAASALLSDAGQSPGDLELIAVSAGPGSFTGLRVGVATAKTMAWALGIPVAPVDVLAAIADQADAPRVRAAINAYRGQVFTADYRRAGERWAAETPVQAVDLLAWQQELPTAACVSGPALSLLDEVPPGVAAAPPERWEPTAETIGKLGGAAHSAGESVAAAEVTIHYGRVSAAEEKRGES